MQHPLEFLPLNLRKPLFYFFLVCTLAIFGVFSILDQPLRTSAAPNGIVSFELAHTMDESKSILNSWDEKARLFAAFGLGFDYLFMPVYAGALSLGLLLAGANKTSWYSSLTNWLGLGAFAAALFDAVENYVLWQILTGNVSSSLPQIAAFCATIKFILLIAGVAVALADKVVKK
jgi:hypothetical protein